MPKIIEIASSAVIEALYSQNYSMHTIKPHIRCLALLRDFCLEKGGDYSGEVGAEFVANMTSRMRSNPCKKTWFDASRCVRMIDSYLSTGKIDLSRRKKSTLSLSSIELSNLLESWEGDMKDRGLAPGTRGQSLFYARRYFTFLEDCAVCSFDAATASSLIAFIESLRKTHSMSGIYSALSSFRRFIKFTGRNDLLSVFGNIGFEQERTIMPLLTEDDLDAVYRTIYSKEVTLRDRAITLLSLTTGLRACDIVGLSLNDIDWRKGFISIVQQKTGNPLVLPLLPAVGNAISEYLLSERPQSEDRYVFLRMRAPYMKLSGHASIYRIIRRIFGLANVEAPFYGTRLTRHNAATRMLLAKTPSPTISAVLGQVDPSSADRYISVDADGMRACVLPLPKGVLL